MALHAATTLAPETILVYRGKMWGNPAGEGVAIQPHLVKLNKAVSIGGGNAWGGQDDVFVICPSLVVFPAIDHFSEQTLQTCGLYLQRSK